MSGWHLERGAECLESGAVRFSVWAPYMEQLTLRLLADTDGVETATAIRMTRGEDGLHELTVADLPAGCDYFYDLGGGRMRPDPVSRHQPRGVHGPSRVVDGRAHRWSDAGWKGIDTADLIIYELHVGTFTESGTFEAVIERLPYLKQLGVTALELMPVAEFPGHRNWGYDGVHLYAPQSSYGGPVGLKHLVDAAHQEGLAVILDVVYNHLGPEGNYLDDFGPYFTDRYHTPWGRAINYDGAESDHVRRYVIDNALSWITDFHLDGLRLDAVHAIFDFSALHILDELTARIHAEAHSLNRAVHVIAESDLNDPRLVRSRTYGGYGLDAQWSDDFHHAVHATLTGERAGYYCDFGSIRHVSKAFRDRFVLDGTYSEFRRRRHGTSAGDVPAERFVVFVQNHDQVGNRAQGDRLATLVSFEAQKLAAALLLLSPYIPLLFMGQEHGEEHPFLYFVSHGDPELVEAVRTGRRREFAAFGWKGELPDPQDEGTFHSSRIDWDWIDDARRTAVYDLYLSLLRLRREEPALRPGRARVEVEDGGDAGWISLTYITREVAPLVTVFNVAPLPVVALSPWPAGCWRLRFTTEDERFGGRGGMPAVHEHERPQTVPLAMPPLSAAVYRREAV